ncbi:Hypothetical protein I5071_1570 (plasmid) [Sandaracinus amylolyticus]|nr:Hypothetical protein I5071_1570 [Sandaracinus amylolyticus]
MAERRSCACEKIAGRARDAPRSDHEHRRGRREEERSDDRRRPHQFEPLHRERCSIACAARTRPPCARACSRLAPASRTRPPSRRRRSSRLPRWSGAPVREGALDRDAEGRAAGARGRDGVSAASGRERGEGSSGTSKRCRRQTRRPPTHAKASRAMRARVAESGYRIASLAGAPLRSVIPRTGETRRPSRSLACGSAFRSTSSHSGYELVDPPTCVRGFVSSHSPRALTREHRAGCGAHPIEAHPLDAGSPMRAMRVR